MDTLQDLLQTAVERHRAGRLAEAQEIYRQILASDPACADAWHLLGVIEHQQGRHAAAIEVIGRAVAISPGVAECHNNLGLALCAAGQLDEAVASYRRAIGLRADFAEAHNNLSNALRDLGRLDEAAASLQTALQLRPDYANAHYNLGGVLKAEGQLDEAIASYRRAVELNPRFADAYYNLANTLKAQGRLDEAVVEFQRALQVRPDFAGACSNLGQVYEERGEVELALDCFRAALRCQPDFAEVHSNLLFVMNYDPLASSETLLAEHRRWADLHAGESSTPAQYISERDPERRLRVGYVSPDFRNHPVSRFIEPILQHHDPHQFETFAYADVPRPDAVSARLQSLAHHWRDIACRSHAAVCQQVRSDRIDILVDLAGHTALHRLPVFAQRAAPVQVTYLGYPNTTGLAAIEYRLTDAIADPPGEAPQHTETLVRLPGCFCCYQGPHDAPAVGPLPASTRGRVTFGSLHALAKLNAQVLDAWCQTLHAAPESRLLVLRSTLTSHSQQRLAAEFERRGIAPSRIEFRSRMPAGQSHLAAYQEIDISLDAFPWSGHTTACESLWMGVPMVTLRGTRHAGRMVASVLECLGLQEWIADSPDNYASVAARMAADLGQLAELRSQLRSQMWSSPLCDGATFTRGLEQAYREMWRGYCDER